MTPSGHQPFDADIEELGRYAYTDETRRSSSYTNRRISDVILDSLDYDGKRVLDIGCGDGTYTAVLRSESRAAEILGIDPAARAIERARQLYATQGLAFRPCLTGDLVREGAEFDIAVFRGVLHHVEDPAGEIGAALRLAERLLILEPNGWNPILKVIERVSPYHRAHQERSYVLGRYRRWIRRGGGRVERAFYYGLVPMFCPDWMVAIGSACEPVVERLAGIRRICCGQLAIVAARRET